MDYVQASYPGSGGYHRLGLIRFDDMFGTGENQIPFDSAIRITPR